MRRKQRRRRASAIFVGVLALVALAVIAGVHLTSGQGTAAANLKVSLQVAPGTFGQNRFLVDVHDSQGRPVPGAHVRLISDMLDMTMRTPDLTAAPVSAERYQAVGLLGMPGHWRITAEVQLPGHAAPSTRAAFTLEISATTHVMPTALPLLGGSVAHIVPTPTPLAPSAVQWTGLPAQAAVSFLTNGLVYLPGKSALLRTGSLTHSIARVPGSGQIWATDYADNTVSVLDPKKDRVLATIPVGLGPVHVVFTPDGRRAWVTNLLSSEVSVIDVATRAVVATVPVGLYPHGLALSPDGRQVWVACGRAGGIWVLDAHTNAVVSQVPAGLQPHAVAFSPDGRTVYMTDASASDLVVLDRTTQNVIARVPIGTGSAMDAVSPDGHRVYVSGQSGSVVSVVDTHTHRVIARVPVGQGPHGLALTADGRFLYVAVNNANHVAVIDTSTNSLRAIVPVPGQADELVLQP